MKQEWSLENLWISEASFARIATFTLKYEDDYEYELSYWACSLGLPGENSRCVCAQYFKLLHLVVLVLQSEGR